MGHLFYPFWRSPYCTSMYILKFYWLRGSKLARACLVPPPRFGSCRNSGRSDTTASRHITTVALKKVEESTPHTTQRWCNLLFSVNPTLSFGFVASASTPHGEGLSCRGKSPSPYFAMASFRPVVHQATHALDPRGRMASSSSLGSPKHPTPFPLGATNS